MCVTSQVRVSGGWGGGCILSLEDPDPGDLHPEPTTAGGWSLSGSATPRGPTVPSAGHLPVLSFGGGRERERNGFNVTSHLAFIPRKFHSGWTFHKLVEVIWLFSEVFWRVSLNLTSAPYSVSPEHWGRYERGWVRVDFALVTSPALWLHKRLTLNRSASLFIFCYWRLHRSSQHQHADSLKMVELPKSKLTGGQCRTIQWLCKEKATRPVLWLRRPTLIIPRFWARAAYIHPPRAPTSCFPGFLYVLGWVDENVKPKKV